MSRYIAVRPGTCRDGLGAGGCGRKGDLRSPAPSPIPNHPPFPIPPPRARDRACAAARSSCTPDLSAEIHRAPPAPSGLFPPDKDGQLSAPPGLRLRSNLPNPLHFPHRPAPPVPQGSSTSTRPLHPCTTGKTTPKRSGSRRGGGEPAGCPAGGGVPAAPRKLAGAGLRPGEAKREPAGAMCYAAAPLRT